MSLIDTLPSKLEFEGVNYQRYFARDRKGSDIVPEGHVAGLYHLVDTVTVTKLANHCCLFLERMIESWFWYYALPIPTIAHSEM